MLSAISADEHVVIAIYSNYRNLLTPALRKALTEHLTCAHCGQQAPDSLARCGCNATTPHPLLECEHEQAFGSGYDFVGLYRLPDTQWQTLYRQIGRCVRDKNREVNPPLQRLSRLDTADQVQEWIDRTHPGGGLQVTALSIPTDTGKAYKKYADVYARCFRCCESSAHGYLKWIALNWSSEGNLDRLDDNILMLGLDMEVLYLLPGNRVSKEWNGQKGRIIPREWRQQAFIPERHEIHKHADVYSGTKQQIIECGETSADSLARPVLAKIAKSVIWIPYLDVTPDQTDFTGIDCLRAFAIKRRSRSRSKPPA